MFTNFKINQAATFQGVAFLSVEPKRKFGSDQQELTKDGRPKWECQVVAGFRDQFGKTNNEVMKVGVIADKDPGKGLGIYTPVELVDFEVGVMPKTTKDKRTGEEIVTGAQVWFRASEIRPLTATGKTAA